MKNYKQLSFVQRYKRDALIKAGLKQKVPKKKLKTSFNKSFSFLQ